MSTTTAGGSASSAFDINPDSVKAIARKDFQDAVRSWLFWGLSLFFFTLMVVMAGVLGWLGEEFTGEVFVLLSSELTRLIIPLIAIILGWRSIAGERETGSIKILLSLPHSRADAVLGKLIGRSAVLSLSLLAGFGLAGIVVVALGFIQFGLGDVSGFLGDYIGLLAISIVYGIAYTALAVTVSALARSTTLAAAGAFGIFVLFYVIWNALEGVFNLLIGRGTISSVEYTIELDGQEFAAERLPDWALFILQLDPGNAYGNTLSMVTSVSVFEIGVELEEAAFEGGMPFFLQDWFSVLILLFWITVPIAFAIYQFDQVDL